MGRMQLTASVRLLIAGRGGLEKCGGRPMRRVIVAMTCALMGCGDGTGTGGTGADGPPPKGTCGPGIYSAGGTYPIGPLIGNTFAGRADPFDSDMVCPNIIVDLFDGNGCTIPNVVDVAAWSEPTWTPTETPSFTTVKPLSVQQMFVGDNNVKIAILPFDIHVKAGDYPFIATRASGATCAVSAGPPCDESKAWVFGDPGWAMMSEALGNQAQVMMALHQCIKE